MIGIPTLADAILDRIIHNAYRIDLAGESLRKTRSAGRNPSALDQSETAKHHQS
jgi:DNA replication protein DnaC